MRFSQSLYYTGVGALLLGLAAYCLLGQLRFWYASRPATATVVALETSYDDETRTSSVHPVVRFTTRRGQAVTARGPGGSATPTYAVGDRLLLRYDPARPRRVQFPDFFSTWGHILLAVVLAFFGAVVLAVARLFARAGRSFRTV